MNTDDFDAVVEHAIEFTYGDLVRPVGVDDILNLVIGATVTDVWDRLRGEGAIRRKKYGQRIRKSLDRLVSKGLVSRKPGTGKAFYTPVEASSGRLFRGAFPSELLKTGPFQDRSVPEVKDWSSPTDKESAEILARFMEEEVRDIPGLPPTTLYSTGEGGRHLN